MSLFSIILPGGRTRLLYEHDITYNSTKTSSIQCCFFVPLNIEWFLIRLDFKLVDILNYPLLIDSAEALY